MREEINELLRLIPSMDELLSNPWVAEYEKFLNRNAVKSVFAEVIGEVRRDLRLGKITMVDPLVIEQEARKRLERRSRRSLKPLVNATGVIVHTNLGRSCLAEEAAHAALEASRRYTTLEYDLTEGKRGQRNDHVEWLLCQLTGADAACVVNNNAGAVLLCLSALVAGKEVIISRGELVEIGGSFRIPEILAFSGARMVDVGTTNRTSLEDYERAITEQTAMLLKVHPSNYRIVGFHEETSRKDLCRLAREKSLLVMEDLGSGMLVDPHIEELPQEATVGTCIEEGVDLVTFSGDKLLGGPQIGGIVGRAQLIKKLLSFPLYRALRVDKMTLAAFEVTLRLYLEGKTARIPTLSLLQFPKEGLKKKAQHLRRRLQRLLPEGVFDVVPVEDAVGGGAFPECPLQGYAVSVFLPWIGGGNAGLLQNLLREGEDPIVAGASENRVLLHVRTLLEGDEERIERAFLALCSRKETEESR